MVGLQEEWLAAQIVSKVTYPVIGRVSLLLEDIPARSDVGELLAGETDGLVDDA